MKQRMKATEEKFSFKKKKIFGYITLLFPIALLIATELLLRWFNYGGNLDLVVKTTIQGKEYYTLNREVARRYFTQKGIGVPEAYDDYFEIKKQPNTKRIFMLGESTMAGYPFDYNATAPRLLKDRLVQLLPQYNIEVINVGLAAVNSYTVLDFVKELVNYEPDAFIVYLGHNEFYGAMGIGSTEYLGQWRSLVNLYIQLRNFKLFLLVRDGIVSLRNLFHSDVTPQQGTLMEMMVREKVILHNSKEYQIAKSNFEANLRDIIKIAKEHSVPIVLSTLTSNIRDQKPFLAAFSKTTSEQAKKEWQSRIDKGMKLFHSGDFTQAKEQFQSAIQIDSLNAEAHFFLGKCHDTLGRYDEAKIAYQKARDYDGLRFRASTDFNQLIKLLCQNENVFLADAEKSFEDHSPHGLVGNTVMLEHLHPNFDGYFLLAKTFYRTLFDNLLFAPKNEWHTERNLSDEEFRKIAGVTEFDLECAKFRIFQLTNGWPFLHASEPQKEFIAENFVQELAVRYVIGKLPWSDARKKLAEWYTAIKQYKKALDEYHAFSKVVPYNYFPVMMMGDMYRMMDSTALAEQTYLKALQLQESPFVHVRLGMLYFEVDNIEKAIQEFELTLTSELKSDQLMDTRARSTVRYFLGASYGKSGNIEKAKMNLQLAVQIDPNNEDAKKMLAQIP
jgi:tetratricopeptide (TPR) repeat protein